ncbi:MAG: O-antigen ligase family protein [bacterium]
MGAIVKQLLPACGIIGIFALYETGVLPEFRDFFSLPRTSVLARYLVFVVITAAGWVGFSQYVPEGIVPSLFSLAALFGVVTALAAVALLKPLQGFIVLMLTLPFLRFVELQSMYKVLSGALIGSFIVTPTTATVTAFIMVYALNLCAKRKKVDFPLTRETKLFILFAVLCGISTIHSGDIGTSGIGLYVEVLLFPFFFFFAKDMCADDKSAITIFYTIIAYVSLRLVFSLYMLLRGMEAGSATYAVSQIEELTTMATLAIPLCIGAVTIAKRRCVVIAALAICAMAFAALIVGDKREPVVALCATLPFLLLMKSDYKKYFVIGLLGGMIALVVFASIVSETHLHTIPTSIDDVMSDNVRMSAWVAALKMMREYPLWGIGFGQFVNMLDSYAPQTFPFLNIWPLAAPHNFILHYVMSIGTLASVALFSLIAISYHAGINIVRKSTHRIITNIAVTIMWALSCFMIASNTGGTMVPFAYSVVQLKERIVSFIPDYGILMWLFMGLLMATYHREKLSCKDSED